MELLLPHVGLLIWTTLAFLIVFFILKKFAWKPILQGLNDREATIASSIAIAEKVKLEMAQLKNENEELLVQAREERAVMLREAKQIKEKMINDAKDEARLQASRIITDAHASINNQKMAAMTDLKNQLGNMVIELSEKVLRKELANKPDQEAFIRQLADDVKLN